MNKKKAGGLGFKDIQCFNLAFLAKIGWRLTLHPTSILASVLRDKYYPGKTFMEAGRGKCTSWGWKGIFDARKVLFQGLRWRVGDGASINIREDPWFPKPTTFMVNPKGCLAERMVSDLIDQSTKSWKVDIISAGFNRDDVPQILSIPLSKSRCNDRLVWHHTVNGVYSVKTGYQVAVKLMENGNLGRKGRGAPSEQQKQNQVWNSIWGLKVPNKIKFFIWRCCNNSLAVRHNLQRRHMRIENICGVCNSIDESENHLFFQCDFSHQLWFCSPLHLNSHDLIGPDFLTSWEKFFNRVKDCDMAEDILQEFAFGLWRLWKNRNEVVFKGLHRQPHEILDTWRMNISEFRDAVSQTAETGCPSNLCPPKSTTCLGIQWQKPEFGFIKINTDAAWCKNTLRAGVGWVGRDFAGLLHAAGGSGTGFCHSAAAAEAHAIRDALEACCDNGFNKVIVESDAKTVIQMILKEISIDFSIECILGDIEVLVRRLTSVMFKFVPREGNRAAHSVAKFVFKEGRNFVWDCIGPDFLFNILAQDVNIPIRL